MCGLPKPQQTPCIKATLNCCYISCIVMCGLPKPQQTPCIKATLNCCYISCIVMCGLPKPQQTPCIKATLNCCYISCIVMCGLPKPQQTPCIKATLNCCYISCIVMCGLPKPQQTPCIKATLNCCYISCIVMCGLPKPQQTPCIKASPSRNGYNSSKDNVSAKTVFSLQERKITHLKSYYRKSSHATFNETQIPTDLKLYARKGDSLQVAGMETYTHRTFWNLHTSSLWKFTHIKSVTISHHMQPARRHKSSLTSNCTWGKETACSLLEWKLTHTKPLQTYTHQASGHLHTSSLLS